MSADAVEPPVEDDSLLPWMGTVVAFTVKTCSSIVSFFQDWRQLFIGFFSLSLDDQVFSMEEPIKSIYGWSVRNIENQRKESFLSSDVLIPGRLTVGRSPVFFPLPDTAWSKIPPVLRNWPRCMMKTRSKKCCWKWPMRSWNTRKKWSTSIPILRSRRRQGDDMSCG